MNKPNNENALHEIIFYNDSTTPSSLVKQLINQVLGIPLYQCDDIIERINQTGKYAFGPFPDTVAYAIVKELTKRVNEAGKAFTFEALNISNPENSKVVFCSFCGKTNIVVGKMFSGRAAAICDECVTRSAGVLQDLLPTSRMYYAYQLLDWHFGDVSIDKFVKTNRKYPGRVRADLQTAIDQLFTAKAIRATGIKQQYSHEKIDLATLWASGRNAQSLAPISYEEVDIGEAAPVQCQINGLWLLNEGDYRYAAILARMEDYSGGFTVSLEISGPQGEKTAGITRIIFDRIEAIIKEAQSYRGKVLSLEYSPHYGGSSTGITVHRMESVSPQQIILQEKIIEELDRTIIRFCENRSRLREIGLSTKRGVMFYGPPGTGKTHTIRYLASKLKGHTTFLVTAEQVGILPEYFALARLMQPAIFVIEDADLLARARESMNSPCEEVLLNHLLNEMDGLKEDADILFILSSNKPEALEEALVSRPGRIDQLIEFPKPDHDCRKRLMKLYGNKLFIDDSLAEDIIKRTEGVSASFIKELMRRLAQYSIEREDDGKINNDDVQQALTEMLFSNNLLNKSILGASD